MLFFLLACDHEKPDSDLPTPVTLDKMQVTGSAGWDPLWADMSDHSIQPLMVEAANGDPVTMAPMEYNGTPYAYTADPWMPPGTYTLLGSEEVAASMLESHEVLDYGQASGFDPTTLAQTTWELQHPLQVLVPSGIGSVLGGSVGPTYLYIESVEGTEIKFRLITSTLDSGDLCQLLRATGTISPTGEFSWSEASIEAATSPTPVQMTNLALHGGWGSDPSHAGGFEGQVTIDTRGIDAYIEPDLADPTGAACDVLDGFGPGCYPCVSDNQPYCADVRFYGGALVPASPLDLDALSMCGFDLEQADVDFSCDFDIPDLSCSSVFFPLGLWSWSRIRRRRSEKSQG